MATVRCFEDLNGWKKARELSREIYFVTRSGPLARDFALRDQMRRAAVSVMANVAEGFGRGGNKEFIQFLGHARGSATEVKSHLYVALDSGELPQVEFDRLYRLASETEALISGLMRYLQNSDSRGRKFKTTENHEP
ncbi:MAG TPA: four helix bundle protein [Croceibacterium sp.]|jgi:four helix bundle protein|nr:four helix bundle protein [Croceibacterium sp.]